MTLVTSSSADPIRDLLRNSSFAGKPCRSVAHSAAKSLRFGKFDAFFCGALAEQARELHARHRVASDDEPLCKGRPCEHAKEHADCFLALGALGLEFFAVEYEDPDGDECLGGQRRVGKK